MFWSQMFIVESLRLRTKWICFLNKSFWWITNPAFLWISSQNQSELFVYKLPIRIRLNQWVELKSHISMNHSLTDSSKRTNSKQIRSWVPLYSSNTTTEWLQKILNSHMDNFYDNFLVLDRPTSHSLSFYWKERLQRSL